MRAFLPFLSLYALAGCAPETAAGTPSCTPTAAEGEVAASIDGSSWASTATWFEAGSSLQVNAESVDGWWFSMVLQTTEDGTAAVDATAAGEWPMAFDIGGGGGWVTLYPDEGASYTSRDGSGALTLVSDEAGLAGCFSFEALGDEGTVTVSDGSFVATASSLR